MFSLISASYRRFLIDAKHFVHPNILILIIVDWNFVCALPSTRVKIFSTRSHRFKIIKRKTGEKSIGLWSNRKASSASLRWPSSLSVMRENSFIFFFRSHITSPRHAESDTNISNGKKRFRQMKLAFFTRNHFAHGSTIFFFWCSPHFRVLIPLRILIFSHLDNINYTHDGRLWIFGSQIQNKTRRNIITSLNSLERLNWIAARWTMNHRHTMEIRTFRRMELTCAPFSISFASQFYSHSTW